MTNKPKKWKMILLTWICIYPLINIIFFVLMPYMIEFHQLLKTLILTLILVPLLSFLLPLLQKKFSNWLYK